MTTAQQGKAAGMASVLANNKQWKQDAMAIIAALPDTFSGIGEDIRHIVSAKIGDPSHHNAWGGLINSAVKRGLLLDTGSRRAMRDSQSHGRTSTMYTKGTP